MEKQKKSKDSAIDWILDKKQNNKMKQKYIEGIKNWTLGAEKRTQISDIPVCFTEKIFYINRNTKICSKIKNKF